MPLFIFMGHVLAASGIAQRLFVVADRLLGRVQSGLALASVLNCGGSSAVCESSLATAATMTRVAMRRFGYSDGLAAGSIAAGGTLSILIPPSVMIAYGLPASTDIGKLFVAGILPGLPGIASYLVAVLVAVRINPELAPPVPAATVPLARRDAT